ncbi:MAG: outer membrane protein assembly factor, partial [Alphaproteobacteria bacterium]|nr:outer membrane protein assembly factor [Alphaproteobacteria bacterium]MBU1828421.1 outer membrane protein assembly factor [Alphaproteobacteria bacterium]
MAAALLYAGTSNAFEATLETTAEGEVKNRLENASAILEAAKNDVTAPEEIIAAVQSDYRALIGALYREGYYGPSISIRVDGREGADMSLISLPSTINTVVINVAPGPRFRFGSATVAPLAPDTQLPEDFASGEVAKSGLVGEAKDVAITAWRQASHAKAALADQLAAQTRDEQVAA